MHSIGYVSNHLGISIPTIRYYEEIGILSPKRTASNQRAFSTEDIRWLEIILILRDIGLSLEQIKDYSIIFQKGNPDAQLQKLLKKHEKGLMKKQLEIENQLIEVRKKIRFLDRKNGQF